MTTKQAQATLGATLAIAGSTMILGATTTFRGEPLAPFGVILGGLGLASAIRVDQKFKLTAEDYIEAAAAAASSVTETLEDAFTIAKPSLRAAAKSQTFVKVLPEPFREPWLARMETAQDTRWLSKFVKKSKIIFGRTRAGKSSFMRWEVAEFYREYPEGRLLIGDLDFGSANEEGVRNFWEPFGLGEMKKRFIRDTIEGILEGIKEFYEEMQRRLEWVRTDQSASIKKWQRWKLLLDELPAIQTEARALKGYSLSVRIKPSDDPVEMSPGDFLTLAIPALLYRGLKQQIEVTFGAQGKAVTETGLNLQQLDQLNFLALGSTALDRKVVSSIPGVEDAASLVEQCRQIRKLPGCQYAAIARIDDWVGVVVVPKLDPEQHQIVLESATNPDEEWLKAVLEGCGVHLEALAVDPAATLTKAVNLANIEAGRQGLAKFWMRPTDPKYRLFKAYWEDLRAATLPKVSSDDVEHNDNH